MPDCPFIQDMEAFSNDFSQIESQLATLKIRFLMLKHDLLHAPRNHAFSIDTQHIGLFY